MNRKKVLLVVIMASITFNALFIFGQSEDVIERPSWLFPELGPAVIQDSSFGRAPALESPIGIIENLPGLYPIYEGNPLQQINDTSTGWTFRIGPLVLAIALSAIPIAIVLLLGRRSYGASKTQ
ncbi:MAG: hypothetical protein ACFFEJ_07420 [Candidatus Thorarchaeota archaeon]